MKKAFYFDQVLLEHNYGDCESRKDLDISVKDKNGRIHNSPVILSNMQCCQNEEVLNIFISKNWPYVLNRVEQPESLRSHHYFYGSDTFFFIKKYIDTKALKSISVGVKEKDLNLLQKIRDYFGKNSIDWLTVDVAFIYNQKYVDHIKKIRKMFPNTYLICGNFTSTKTVEWLKSLGVDCGKFGISTSQLCRTGAYTGFSSSAADLLDVCEFARAWNLDIIQDGGLTILDEKTGEIAYGDIFKSLNFGAKWVMSSSLFRWCKDFSNIDGKIIQYGNSTKEAKGYSENIEGCVKTVSTNGITVSEQIKKIKENLQSSMSYAGIKNLKSAYNSCNFSVCS